MKYIKEKLLTIFNPSYWYSDFGSVIDKQWTNELLNLIENKAFISTINEFTIKIGKYVIWISNYPYAFGSKYTPFMVYHRLPKRYARILLKKYILGEIND